MQAGRELFLDHLWCEGGVIQPQQVGREMHCLTKPQCVLDSRRVKPHVYEDGKDDLIAPKHQRAGVVEPAYTAVVFQIVCRHSLLRYPTSLGLP